MVYGRNSTAKRSSFRSRRFNRSPYRAKYVPYRRRYKKSAYRVRKSRWLKPNPHLGYYKLGYTTISQSAGLALGNNYTVDTVFNANSMYDPENAIGGGQPYGFDQYCSATAPFNRYKVLGSKIRVYLHDCATATAIRVSVFPTLTAVSSLVQFPALANQPYVRQFVLQNGNDTHNKISNYCSTKKMWGVRDVDDVTFASPYNASPTNMWYWHVVVDGSTQAAQQTIKFDVKITYYVQFSQTQQIPDS